MKTIFINTDGYIASPEFTNCEIPIEVSDELYEQLSHGPIGYTGAYDFSIKQFNLKALLDNTHIKLMREIQCFNIIDNRSQMGYNNLTNEQKQELNTGYQAWLDAPETKIIPEKPEWLK